MRRGGVGLLGALAWLAGCAGDWGPKEALVDHERWRLATEDDVFGAPPDDLYCDPLGWGYELLGPEPSLQVWTDGCAWATLTQPSLLPLKAGDRVDFRLWHDPLIAPEPAVATVGLAIGGHVLGVWRLPIPSDAGPVLGAWRVPWDLDAGTPVLVHVENHGTNSYHVLDVARRTH